MIYDKLTLHDALSIKAWICYRNCVCQSHTMSKRMNYSKHNDQTVPCALLDNARDRSNPQHRSSSSSLSHYYLPRREVGVAGNILMSGTVHGIVPVHGICLSANSKLLQCFWNGWSYIRSSNLANVSSMAGFTPKVKNFPWKGHGHGHVTLLKMLNRLQYFWNGWSCVL